MAKKHQRKRHIQLTLDQARRPMGHGGWRPGAGRPRTRKGVSHEAREPVSANHPQHVTFRLVDGLPSVRQRKLVAELRRCIASAHRENFRIIEFSIEANHMHFIIEASDNTARARGIQGLKTRLATCVNRYLGRTGKVFAERYHARALKTPREVRLALRYVLNNARHHGIDLGRDWIDPSSSAVWFDGWKEPIQPDTWWKRELLAEPSPVAKATVWLLRVGWRRYGAIGFDEVPGPQPR
jgi:REP element-mobilizing transposase RayT